MGTPAFPNLGKHCSVDHCRQIDFLPFTCDCCQQVYCLDHRSYSRHQCPKANKNDVTVVVCPLCAKGVRLIPEEDPNITWESHVNIECDPSNYEQATKKRKCPVPRCREMLTFSNTIKCRDCNLDHCLKHRFGPDHNCTGPKKPESTFQFMSFLNNSRKDDPKQGGATSSSKWASSFLKVASSVRASAEAGMERLSNEFNQALGVNGGPQKNGSTSYSGSGSGREQVEVCPQCKLRFSTVGALVEHVSKVHERNGVMKSLKDTIQRMGSVLIVFSDASVLGDREKCAIGAVGVNEKGEIRGFTAKAVRNPSSVFGAELIAIKEGINLAKSMGSQILSPSLIVWRRSQPSGIMKSFGTWMGTSWVKSGKSFTIFLHGRSYIFPEILTRPLTSWLSRLMCLPLLLIGLAWRCNNGFKDWLIVFRD